MNVVGIVFMQLISPSIQKYPIYIVIIINKFIEINKFFNTTNSLIKLFFKRDNVDDNQVILDY